MDTLNPVDKKNWKKSIALLQGASTLAKLYHSRLKEINPMDQTPDYLKKLWDDACRKISEAKRIKVDYKYYTPLFKSMLKTGTPEPEVDQPTSKEYVYHQAPPPENWESIEYWKKQVDELTIKLSQRPTWSQVIELKNKISKVNLDNEKWQRQIQEKVDQIEKLEQKVEKIKTQHQQELIEVQDELQFENKKLNLELEKKEQTIQLKNEKIQTLQLEVEKVLQEQKKFYLHVEKEINIYKQVIRNVWPDMDENQRQEFQNLIEKVY